MKQVKNNPSQAEIEGAHKLHQPIKSFKMIQPKRYVNYDDSEPNWIEAKELIDATFFIHKITGNAEKLYYKVSVSEPDAELRTLSLSTNAPRTMMRDDLANEQKKSPATIYGPMTIEQKELSKGRTYYDLVPIETPF